ncbi:hypothetical protein Q604_UNBC12882G0001, partial [human gut metagenome]
SKSTELNTFISIFKCMVIECINTNVSMLTFTKATIPYTNISIYDYARVDYENHWALSENTVARGYDIGYARTFKNAWS